MPRRRDPAKSSEWRDRLDRFRRWEHTVFEFCQDEGVSVASFYHWRRRLGENSAANDKAAFQPITVTSVPGVRIELRSGVRIEVAAENLKLVRTVLREVVRGELAAGDDAC